MVAEWSTKTGRPTNDILKMLEDSIQLLKTAQPGRTDDWYEQKARFLVYRELKEQLRFPGLKQFDGIFLGYGSRMDVFSRRRDEAMNLYKTNPIEALDRGFVNKEGKPIYKLPSGAAIDISNPVYLRQSVAVGRLASGGPVKVIVQTHRMDQALKLPPRVKPVRFTSMLKQEKSDRIIVNTAKRTDYGPIEMNEFKDFSEKGIWEIVQGIPDTMKVTCTSLEPWHKANAQDKTRVCMLEGEAVFVRREPTATGNLLMVLEDETLMDLNAEGITSWVHGEIADMLNFGSGSHVAVIGRTMQMPGWNRDTRQVDRTKIRTGLNAFAVYADPSFRQPLDEESVLNAGT